MYEHRKLSPLRRFFVAARQVRDMLTTGWIGPCGHEVSGDASSWSCGTCGSSGSSS